MTTSAVTAPVLAGVGGGGDLLDLVAPATGEVLARAQASRPGDVVRAVELARAAQRGWAGVPLAARLRVVRRVHDLVLARREELTTLVQDVTGKARGDAFLEVVNAVQVARHHAVRGSAYLRPRRRAGAVPGLTGAVVRRVPVGVVGNIAAWNYPLVFVLSDAVPALLAGNAVVTKPDVRSLPLADAVTRLLRDAGLPDHLFAVLAGNDAATGEALVAACDHVLFTGSEAVGRQVASAAGRRLVGVTLELGGKNALYVAADADVERVAEAAVRDCFGGAGQTCTSTERLFVHEQVVERFTAAFLARVRALRLGFSHDFEHDMGSLVSPEHLEGVLEHVRDAVEQGARVLTGGRARPDLGPAFLEPTVLTDVPDTARCAREETFGPVVSLRTVRSDTEALALVNATETGLMASVWSRDVRRAQRLAAQVDAGTVLVNETYVTAWGSVAAPIGGTGASSGYGRRYGPEGIAEVTRAHVVLTQRTPVMSAVFDLPDATWTAGFATAARLMRVLRIP